MARNRKAKSKSASANPEPMEISEEEQWRLVNETGILKNAIPRASKAVAEDEEEEDTPLAEEIFNSILFIIPFSFCLLLFEILIHHQYGQQPTFKAIMDRMLPGVPILSVFIFYTTRYKQTRGMQAFLLVLSVIVGTRMVWLVNRGPFMLNMQQCPPLATMWIYTVVQLDLAPAVLSLAVVGGWMRWKGLKITF